MSQIKTIYGNEFVDEFARENMITKPTSAQVGQMLVVKAVDENGVPTEWDVVDAASGGSGFWTYLDTFDLSSGAVEYQINTSGYNEIVYVVVKQLDCSGMIIKWKESNSLTVNAKTINGITTLSYMGNGRICLHIPRQGDNLLNTNVLNGAIEDNNVFKIAFSTVTDGIIEVYGR